jgi:hypothetical protein
MNWRDRDQPDIRISGCGDAASIRICGTLVAAAQHKSSMWLFAGHIPVQTEAAISLRPGWTNETRTKRRSSANVQMSGSRLFAITMAVNLSCARQKNKVAQRKEA